MYINYGPAIPLLEKYSKKYRYKTLSKVYTRMFTVIVFFLASK